MAQRVRYPDHIEPLVQFVVRRCAGAIWWPPCRRARSRTAASRTCSTTRPRWCIS